MRKILLTLALIIGAQAMIFGQSGWNWPEDPDKKSKAMEKNALYSDFLTAEKYEKAKPPLEWLLKETPDLNPSIYIQGVKIYENLAETTTGQEQKNMQDSVVILYDLRMKYFNDIENVTNRKANDAYNVWKERKDKYKELYEIEKEAIEMLGAKGFTSNTIYYMDAARRYKLTGGPITDLDIIAIYDQVQEILDKMEANGESKQTIEKARDYIETLFNASVTIDCNIIDEELYPAFIEDGKNQEDAERIVKFGLAGGCTSSDSFIEAAKVVQANTPEFGLARMIALKSKSNGDLDVAQKYLEEALEYTEDNIKKAEVYIELADIASKQGNRSQARSFAYNALEADPSKTTAYTIIGDLYFQSFNDCKGGKDIVVDRAVFIAAYDMYQKGGAEKRMSLAKEQFPSNEDIFNYDYEIGEELTVGCWINETIQIQIRD
ncbi:tetratricopeptide repeat protein [Marivirga sp.]|uniref:tetratricopeptide repeat protein n=1 Tax=Marivirga sp. TaxID=2018662 RepID=UPI002D7F081E|nr:tetratricopeptide repeat protein [Marivirga sp.]HET8859851.1 tetratricopeptide repeat protein [Marivirga sp.]